MSKKEAGPGAAAQGEHAQRSPEAPGQVVHFYFGGGRAVFFNVIRPHYLSEGVSDNQQGDGLRVP